MQLTAAGITLYFVLVAVALFVPSSGYFIENYGGITRESYLWNYNCDYRGNYSEIRIGIRSFLRCGEACIQYQNCSFFTLDLNTEICYLKKLPLRQLIVERSESICGEIPERVFTSSGSNRAWTLSEDGSIRWSYNCTFKDLVPLSISVNGINSASDCGEMCKSYVNCNYFYLYLNVCNLYKAIGRVPLTINSSGTTCGYIPDRLYNQESITKCNFKDV